MSKPNIFKYATSELSQDAMICYLLEWAKKGNEKVDVNSHKIGKALIDSFFDKCKIAIPQYDSVEIIQQESKIDVLCIVNETYYIIIEDKTDTSHHNDQLNRYLEAIVKKDIEEKNILKIYYKTGEEFNTSTLSGYKYFTKDDILKVLNIANTDNQIILDYKEHIQSLYDNSLFKTLPISKWQTNTWIAFVRELQNDGVELGTNITQGRGQNKGIYFNYKIIEKDKVGFYLRISFDTNALELKLQSEGTLIDFKIADQYYQISKQNKYFGDSIQKAKFSLKETKTKIIGIQKQKVLHPQLENNTLLDYEATKQFIKNSIERHNRIINSIMINETIKN